MYHPGIILLKHVQIWVYRIEHGLAEAGNRLVLGPDILRHLSQSIVIVLFAMYLSTSFPSWNALFVNSSAWYSPFTFSLQTRRSEVIKRYFVGPDSS